MLHEPLKAWDSSQDSIHKTNSQMVSELLKGNREIVKKVLSYGKLYSDVLREMDPEGHITNEKRDETPKKMDEAFEEGIIGMKRIDSKSYDLTYNDTVKISNKSQEEFFNEKKQITKKIQLSKVQGKTSSVPEFDAMILLQHTPYLACAVVSYPDLISYILVNERAGIQIRPLPFSCLDWIIHPSKHILPETDSETREEIFKTVNSYEQEMKLIGKKFIMKPRKDLLFV